MLSEQIVNWTKAYAEEGGMAYPAEYVIRMFKGNYPKLNLMELSGGGIKGKVYWILGAVTEDIYAFFIH